MDNKAALDKFRVLFLGKFFDVDYDRLEIIQIFDKTMEEMMPINTNVSDVLKLPRYALREKLLAACREHMEETGLRIFKYNVNVSMEKGSVEEYKVVEVTAEVEI